MKTKFFYGSVDKETIEKITDQVCNVLGHGKNKTAKKLILGTIAQETHMGLYRDPTPFIAGAGLCQFDKIGFDDVKARTREHHKVAIEEEFGINIDKVDYSMLEYNAVLSIIFCRLKYKLIAEPIPIYLHEIAAYWKKYYNTILGKGSADEFVENYTRFVNKSSS